MAIVSEWSTQVRSRHVYISGKGEGGGATIDGHECSPRWWRRLRKWLINRQEFLNVRFALFFPLLHLVTTHPWLIAPLFSVCFSVCLPSSLYPTKTRNNKQDGQKSLPHRKRAKEWSVAGVEAQCRRRQQEQQEPGDEWAANGRAKEEASSKEWEKYVRGTYGVVVVVVVVVLV